MAANTFMSLVRRNTSSTVFDEQTSCLKLAMDEDDVDALEEVLNRNSELVNKMDARKLLETFQRFMMLLTAIRDTVTIDDRLRFVDIATFFKLENQDEIFWDLMNERYCKVPRIPIRIEPPTNAALSHFFSYLEATADLLYLTTEEKMHIVYKLTSQLRNTSTSSQSARSQHVLNKTLMCVFILRCGMTRPEQEKLFKYVGSVITDGNDYSLFWALYLSQQAIWSAEDGDVIKADELLKSARIAVNHYRPCFVLSLAYLYFLMVNLAIYQSSHKKGFESSRHLCHAFADASTTLVCLENESEEVKSRWHHKVVYAFCPSWRKLDHKTIQHETMVKSALTLICNMNSMPVNQARNVLAQLSKIPHNLIKK